MQAFWRAPWLVSWLQLLVVLPAWPRSSELSRGLESSRPPSLAVLAVESVPAQVRLCPSSSLFQQLVPALVPALLQQLRLCRAHVWVAEGVEAVVERAASESSDARCAIAACRRATA